MESKVVILAAGEGTRMKSQTPKVLHRCAGKSLGGAEFKAPEQTGGVNRAEIIFYKNGVTAGKYYIDIYSPFGEFLEG